MSLLNVQSAAALNTWAVLLNGIPKHAHNLTDFFVNFVLTARSTMWVPEHMLEQLSGMMFMQSCNGMQEA